MKFLATIREFTSILFNISTGAATGNNIEIKPASTAVDSEANISYNLPDGQAASGGDDTIALLDEGQTFTNKTIDGDLNTIQDLPVTSIKTVLGDANKFIARDGAGIPISTNTVPTGTVVGTTDTQTLSNKTLDNPKINDLSDTHTYNILPSEITSDFDITLPVINANTEIILGGATQTLDNKSINADNNTITNIDNNEIKAAAGIEVNKLEALTASKLVLTDGSGFLTATSLAEGSLVLGDASSNPTTLALGGSGTVLTSNGTTATWDTPAGTGDVTAAANLTDNSLIRGNGGAKGIQDSNASIDDVGYASGFELVGYNTTIDADITIASGTTAFHPGPTIDTGDTVTVDSGAVLVTFDGIVNGTIINNGTHIVK
jgi:hypothetical protein